jgi:DNA-binding LytR/AlgR family response regulator
MSRALRVFVVDDEPLAVRRLRRMLEATGRVAVTGDTTDPREAARAIRDSRPDVAFLDVEMPAVTGLALAAVLGVPPWIVFVTAHARYSLDAFGVAALDYLVKPVREADLARALDKVERAVAVPEIEASAASVALRMSPSTSAPALPGRIAARSGAKHIVLDLAGVTHFGADAKQTVAFSGGVGLDVDATLNALEARLGPGFLRIHRAVLVNLAWVREVEARSSAGACVRLSDDRATELPVARDRVRELKDKLGIGETKV